MAAAAASPLELLNAKAMLLLRREREVYELRQDRGRAEAWISVFSDLSFEPKSKDPAVMLRGWVDAMVSELDFQVAAAYKLDPADCAVHLLEGESRAPLPALVQAGLGAFEHLLENPSGQYEHDAPAALHSFAEAVGLGGFFWFTVVSRDIRLLLVGGFLHTPVGCTLLHSRDLAHFVLLGKHLNALLDNIALVTELDREKLDLWQSNGQLDTSLRDLRETQRKLVESSRVLVEVSRRAGMADIATGILHNVGNALNSVNTSAAVAIEQLLGLRLAGLSKVAEVVESDAVGADSAELSEERRKKSGAYLRALALHLHDAQTGVVSELVRMQQHIDHIKSIVSKQQAYAKNVGVIEPCFLSHIMDDAIGMAQSSLMQLDITVEKDCQELPEVLLDRHKVLQILVNLVSNAKHALVEVNSADRRIIARVLADGSGHVLLSVEDNGSGIAEEQQPQLFTHGFTTKKHGHGFGLHNSALAAKEMGGELSFFSAGQNKGSKFVLTLPLTEYDRREQSA